MRIRSIEKADREFFIDRKKVQQKCAETENSKPKR